MKHKRPLSGIADFLDGFVECLILDEESMSLMALVRVAQMAIDPHQRAAVRLSKLSDQGFARDSVRKRLLEKTFLNLLHSQPGSS